MKKIVLFVISLAFSFSTFAANIDRVEPLFWWIGMKNPTVQLMVYGSNIASSQVNLNYPGVSIETVTRSTNPNYLFIDLKISPEAKAGKLPLQFIVSKKEMLTFSYELKDREPNSASRKSYTNADVMYLLFPDRFADGDPTNNSVEGMPDKFNRGDSFGRHGGDIKGITDHLDYLKELGVTAIWSTPLLEDNQPRGSYHQYATTNYYKIDPRFGTNDDYKNMVAKCHQNGIKVIMDMIPNHCGSAHAWMKDLPFHDWINGDTVYTQTNYRISTITDPYTSQFDKNLNSDGWFVREMPDMNQRNPYMLTYLKQFAIWWVEFSGLDGIRVDTYPYNDPAKVAEWTKAIRAEYPNINIVGECWQHSVSDVAYWQSGTQNYDGYDSGLPSVMDFNMHDAISGAFNENEQGWDGGVARLWQKLTQDYLYANPSNLVIFTENHDTQRFSTVVGNDVKKYLLGFTYLLTTRGIPQIYYGSEIMMGGDKGKGDGDIRRDMPGGWTGDTRSVFTASGRTETENQVFNYMKKLIHWRNENPVIHSGRLLHYIPRDNVYTYFRMNAEKTVMVVLNNNAKPMTVDPKLFGEGTTGFIKGNDVISGKTVSLSQPFELEGKTAVVLELKK
ncbi:MAG TPA: glycoside hydrolase family 13 protein [Prolixibacteraceae bacterium]|nr:glycoside hydrolase family 13 protein [Prolixibacteraceae bacterium]HPR84538.1 glycoside hydrolase family 13 protein [Prolixibacteraceae bacterium]